MMAEISGGMVTLLAIFGGILGLVVGSFLNVVVYRVPHGLSIVSPPSACPRCSAPIKPYDNVPVLSWMVLRGKCRNCRTAISLRYPMVELGTAVFFGAVVWGILSGWIVVGGAGSALGTAVVIAAYLYLAAVSVALALIDVDTHRLPNSIVLPSYLIGAVLLATAAVVGGDLPALLRAGIGLAALGGAYFLMALVYPGGMGLGDVKLAGVLGLYLGFLGWGQLAVGAFGAFLIGGLFATALVLLRRANRKSGIPFGPWMLVGAWVGIFFGSRVWDGYLTLLGLA